MITTLTSNSNYGVTRDGRIWSFLSDLFLQPALTAGYKTVSLQGVNKRVHRAVAETYIPNPDNKPAINHKDGIRTNNNVENLEWVTFKENAIHKAQVLFSGRGVTNSGAVLTEQDVQEIRQKFVPRVYTLKMLSGEYGVPFNTIYSVISGQSWSWLPIPEQKNGVDGSLGSSDV